jgi:hypothetical protein
MTLYNNEQFVPISGGVMIHFDHLITAIVRGISSVDVSHLTDEQTQILQMAVDTMKRRIASAKKEE